MFSHIVVGVSDFDRALRFYEPLFCGAGRVAAFLRTRRAVGRMAQRGGGAALL